MPRRAILHIGAPRTGTTTLQSLLHRHRAAMAEAGVLYPALTPASETAEHLNHQHLGEALDGRRPRAERRELLAGLDRQLAATGADVLILSYERLCILPRWRGAPAALAALLARHGFAAELLLTVRPQAGAAQSRYAWRCQFLREARPFRDAYARDLGGDGLDPGVGLAAWLPAAGGRATAVPLVDARSSAPLAVRAVEALGLADRIAPLLSTADLRRSENRSLSPATLEASRRLRATGARLRDNGAARGAVDLLDEEIRRLGFGDGRFHGLDAGLILHAEERFARRNELFAQRLWGETWAARVAPDRAGPVTDLAQQGPLPRALEAALAEACAAARARFVLDTPGWPAAAVSALRRLVR